MSRALLTASLLLAIPATTCFAQQLANAGPGGPYKVIAADFTGDRVIDLALAYHGVGLVTLETGDGSGRFVNAGLIESQVPPPSRTYGVYNFDHADVDRDGLPDLACAFFGIPPDEWNDQDIAPERLRAAWHGNIVIARNMGNGKFQKMAEFETVSIATAVRFIDLDRDGRLDLAYTARGSGYKGDLEIGRLAIRQGLGDWKFGPAREVDAGRSAYNVEIADLNHDQLPDILVSNEHADTVTYFLNPGSTLFAEKRELTPRVLNVGRFRNGDRTPAVNHVRAADFNGDGHTDLAKANLGVSTISVFLGRGDGTFQKDLLFDGGKNCAFLDVADLDSDGDVDLVATHWTEDFLSVFLNDGKGTFSKPTEIKTASGNYGVTVCDLDRDGKLDVVTANYRDRSISMLKGVGDGTFHSANTTLKGQRRQDGKWLSEIRSP